MERMIQVLTVFSILTTIYCVDCNTVPEAEEVKKCCDSPRLSELDSKDCTKLSVLDEAECILKKIKAINNGKPNASALKKQAAILLEKHPEWESKFDMAIDKCVAEVDAKDSETRKRFSEPPYNFTNPINSLYLHLLVCVDGIFFLECPSTKRTVSPKCNDIQDYIKVCLNDFPPKSM